MYHFVGLILLIKCENRVKSPLGESSCSSSDRESQFSFIFPPFLFRFFFSPGVEVAPAPASQSEGGNVLQREELLQQNQELFHPPSLVTVWGIQSKVCPVTCSPRNKQPAESPKTKAIRGGRLVCEPNRGTFLKASIIEKL